MLKNAYFKECDQKNSYVEGDVKQKTHFKKDVQKRTHLFKKIHIQKKTTQGQKMGQRGKFFLILKLDTC